MAAGLSSAGDGAGERPLAHKLTTLLHEPERRILFVGTLPRMAAVLARAGRESAVPFGRKPHLTWNLFHLHPDSARQVMAEMGWLGLLVYCLLVAAPILLGLAEYRELPSDGKRYQILEGNLDVNPAPSTRHQRR